MNKKCCDNCCNYHWYYDYCDKWRCKVDDRSICTYFIDKEKEKHFKTDYNRGRCNPCPYAEEMNSSDGWFFLGCFHKPYNGKWVVEIKDCPKEREEQ